MWQRQDDGAEAAIEEEDEGGLGEGDGEEGDPAGARGEEEEGQEGAEEEEEGDEEDGAATEDGDEGDEGLPGFPRQQTPDPAALRAQEELAAADQAEERRREREQAMLQGVTLTHSVESVAKFAPRTLVNGVRGWADRKYEYTEVPEDMLDGIFFLGAHKVPEGVLTLRTSLAGTAYIWCELPACGGGFDKLEWEPAGAMQYTHASGTTELTVYKKDVHADQELAIPVRRGWIGGVGFQMAPEAEDVEESDEAQSEEEKQPSCLWRLWMWFKTWDALEALDQLLIRCNPVVPLERLATRLYDASVRYAVKVELACIATGDRYPPHWRRHWLFFLWPADFEQESRAATFSAHQVLQVYRHVQPAPPAAPPLGGVKSARELKVALKRLCFRLFLAGFGALVLHLCLAMAAFSIQDVRSDAHTGVLLDKHGASSSAPLAVASTVEMRPLWDYPRLTAEELRRVEDVVFVYNQATHVVRVARITKTAAGSVVVATADGATVRVEATGRAFWAPQGQAEVELTAMNGWRAVPASPAVAWRVFGTLPAHATSAA